MMDRYLRERDFALENGVNIDKIILIDKKKMNDMLKTFLK